jgi:hypothetical protein
MVLAHKRLENCWSNTFLIVIVLGLLFICNQLCFDFLCEALLGIFTTSKSIAELPDLTLEAIW